MMHFRRHNHPSFTRRIEVRQIRVVTVSTLVRDGGSHPGRGFNPIKYLVETFVPIHEVRARGLRCAVLARSVFKFRANYRHTTAMLEKLH